MRRTFLMAVLLCLSAFLSAQVVRTPASDPRITYVGRTLVSGEEVSFDWTGTHIRIAFEGDDLALCLSDTKKDYFNVWIDGEALPEPDFVATFQGDTTVVLCDRELLRNRYGKKIPKTHTAILGKRTEGEQGKVTVRSVLTSGALLQAEPVRPRVIEFIGDSYTCGYGSENSIATDKFKPETENQHKAYDAILARYFGADAYVVAHSGMGINRNYNDKLRGYTMVDRYLHVFDNGFDRVEDAPLWSPDKAPVRPSITVIYLGANDFSAGRQPLRAAFVKDYIRLLKEVKAFYGEDHPILCAASRMEIWDYVQDAVDAAGMKHVACCGFNDKVYAPDERGAASHPAYAAHRKLALGMIPYIATLTGWPLEDRPVR